MVERALDMESGLASGPSTVSNGPMILDRSVSIPRSPAKCRQWYIFCLPCRVVRTNNTMHVKVIYIKPMKNVKYKV